MRSVRLLLLLVVLPGCPRPIPPAPPPVDAPTCSTACENLARMKCLAATPTSEGAPCTEVCGNVQDSGVVSWNLKCLSEARTCEAAEGCNTD